MSYQLNVDQLLEALTQSDHPRAAGWQAQVEALATGMALEVAQHLGIRAGVGTFEGVAFAGTCVPFYPICPNQPLPEVFAEHEFDNAEEWAPE